MHVVVNLEPIGRIQTSSCHEKKMRLFCVWIKIDLLLVNLVGFIKNIVLVKEKWKNIITYFISRTRFDISCTPILQNSTFPWNRTQIITKKMTIAIDMTIKKIDFTWTNIVMWGIISRNTKSSSLVHSNHPSLVIRANSVTKAWRTKGANFELEAM